MGKKVLVVDDDPDVRLFNVTVLEKRVYAVGGHQR
jgi:CheY-like chemotaxis protein